MNLSLISLFTGPRLFWVYGQHKESLGSVYQPNTGEHYGQQLITIVKTLTELSLYTSPFWLLYFNRFSVRYMENMMVGATVFYTLGIILRSFGRMASPVYIQFIQDLNKAKESFDSEAKEKLTMYDFEFYAWPKEYENKRSDVAFVSRKEYGIARIPHRIIGFAMINTFGLKMIYPGSTRWLLQSLLAPALAEQRSQLVVKRKGVRVKIITQDENEIDAMFFDRRRLKGKGQTLVINCEGNAGFYEIGMLTTPLQAGYSVIGWNHPGFWGSTGSPFPEQDARAVDSVMQYALDVLGFDVEDILVYGWSIGGYPATWLAMNYPEIKGLILDATFDHISPLAVSRMPESLAEVVNITMNYYVNLDIGNQLLRYPGPVRFIKRTRDEIISTDDSNVMASNRGNNLFVLFMKHRYPQLTNCQKCVDTLWRFISTDQSTQDALLQSLEINVDQKISEFQKHVDEVGHSYPSVIGEDLTEEEKIPLLLVLATKYRTEYDSGHNNPLPVDLFQLPWQVKKN